MIAPPLFVVWMLAGGDAGGVGGAPGGCGETDLVVVADDAGVLAHTDPDGWAVFAEEGLPAAEVRAELGTPVLLSALRYRIWLETGERISPYQNRVRRSCRDDEKPGSQLVTLSPDQTLAGSVDLSNLGDVAKEQFLMLVLGGYQQPDGRVPMERWVALPRRPAAIRLPPGSLLAARVDRESGRWKAIAAPVDVESGRTERLDFASPVRGRANLALELVCSSLCPVEEWVEVHLVTSDGVERPPDFLRRTDQGLLVAWRSVSAGSAALEIESGKWRVADSVAVDLQSSSHSLERRQLVPLPALTVFLELPKRLRQLPAELALRALPSRQLRDRLELAPGEPAKVFPHVPASELEVRLFVGPFEIVEPVDLRDGRDAQVVVSFGLTRVHGEVSVGGDPAKATIRFKTRQNWERTADVATDDEGRYETWLVAGRPYHVAVEPAGRGAPYYEPGVDVAGEDLLLDFRLPGNEYVFVVLERASREPIAGAQVLIDNRGDDGVTTSLRITTDAMGRAVAQPLRSGAFEAVAIAKGYRRSDPMARAVTKDAREELELLLDLEEEGATVEIRDAAGRPLAGAELWLDPYVGAPRSILRTGADGKVTLPREAEGMPVLIRAPGAASAVHFGSDAFQVWQLPPAAEPLTLLFVDPDGAPIPWASLEVSLDGVLLTGGALEWAVGASTTRADGTASLVALPPRPLALGVSYSAQGAEGSALRSLRRTIGYPWPALVSLEIAP